MAELTEKEMKILRLLDQQGRTQRLNLMQHLSCRPVNPRTVPMQAASAVRRLRDLDLVTELRNDDGIFLDITDLGRARL